jgi:hypothetical protein
MRYIGLSDNVDMRYWGGLEGDMDWFQFWIPLVSMCVMLAISGFWLYASFWGTETQRRQKHYWRAMSAGWALIGVAAFLTTVYRNSWGLSLLAITLIGLAAVILVVVGWVVISRKARGYPPFG